jgi:hypothetical protein
MITRLLFVSLFVGLLPLSAIAGVGGGNANSNWTIYGWQNYGLNFQTFDTSSIDPADADGTREIDNMTVDADAANIGFAANIDTGVSVAGTAVKATFQCEMFTFHNRFSDFSFNNLCSRNSKLGLAGPWGEVMFGAWLTPYNEITAQWIDPFYDAGNQTHSTLMGLSGFGSSYGNGGFDSAFGGGMANVGFMRRKPELLQWMSPNWNGFTARLAYSNSNSASGFGHEEQQVVGQGGVIHELDPTLISFGAAYTKDLGNDNIWFGFGYQQHDEWAAADFGCSDSDDDTMRLATRYIHDWGNGHATTLSLAYEEMSWEWDECGTTGNSAGPFTISATTDGNIDVEREVWLISGKHNFPGPLDVRWMYSEADDFDCSNNSAIAGQSCGGIDDSNSGAEQLSLGVFYTMPAGTELRFVYGEVDNDANSANDWGINAVGVVQGGKAETYQFGLVQWF